MQAIQFTAPREIKIVDLPEPTVPGPGEALVRTHRMGICGTDLSCYLGKFPFFAYPRTPGHELGLEVVAVAADVTNVKPGDECSLEPYVNDPASPTSLKGSQNCCPGVQVIGVHSGLVFEQEREAFAELNDEAGPELARKIDFDEADVGASKPTGWSGARFGHPGENARPAPD